MDRLTAFVVMRLSNWIASSAMLAMTCWLLAFDEGMWAALRFGCTFACVAACWSVIGFAKRL